MAAKQAGSLPSTRDDGFFLAQCVAVADESVNVKTFEFVAVDGRSLDYAAGQHITVEAPTLSGILYRCYTLSSTPTRAGRFAITAKAAPHGPVSAWLHQEIAPGARFRISPPSGAFIAPEATGGAYLFVAGGVGITPLLSMTRALYDARAEIDLVFLQCASTQEDLLFRKDLEEMAASWPSLQVKLTVSREAAVPLLAGRLERAKLAQWIPDIAKRTIYCCGPDAFMKTVYEAAVSLGVAPQRYHQESFVLPLAANAFEAVVPTAQVSVMLAASRLECVASTNDVLIDAAQSVGVVIPSACRAGMCGTCKTRVIAGQVEMAHNGGITDEEIAEGWILTCCARPLTDIELDC
ncbi:ferredoxin-NADP reductase [Paraburkholderia sp. BL23I1N1]|uniref:flavin reductase family protein n=1 Tax=Paraburkholderia sp. BL23I1N1 TaxID=1938802 RepID=UPI000FEEB255|nr:iron-sulfur cluster-binding domain-containing protein [Paraburkholderia sp. BL23I1N1]RKE23821.1 ferredoxin-NADP reductase [Paraburkholderia sp. BL23I1N1]